MKDNQKLSAIVAIRNLVVGISNDWRELKSLGAEIDESVALASTTFLNQTPVSVHQEWQKEITKMKKNIRSLKDIMSQTADKINRRDSKGLTETWNRHRDFSMELLKRLNTLNNFGSTHIPTTQRETWATNWNSIFDKYMAIQQLVEGSNLHLSLISEFAPEEMDELTDTILKNMPKGYSMEEALQYEKEYMEAYEELKKGITQKKNLWDRFLDILAGGVQQSPAERVMLQRWVNGEKGAL